MIEFRLPLLAVKDVEASKRFYAELFGQSVALDLGRNVTFSGGFAVQEDFAPLIGIPAATMRERPHNMELYFETDDFDAFLRMLEQRDDIRYLHPPKKHEWQQRVVRIYDPDGHIIEIGEAMAVIARRFLAAGYGAEETARLIQHPLPFVLACAEERD